MCTSIICGKNATADHVVLIARNEDYGSNNWNKYMKFRKEAPYSQEQEIWKLGNGLQVPVPEHAFSYCSMPDAQGQEEADYAIGDHFLFEARGINEKNVAISATNSLQMNDKASAADPLGKRGMEESIIATLLLPQATSARHAVELLGGYVSEYGASEANGILMSDENEAWYFEIGSRYHWIAVRVPDDSYLVVPNCMRVNGVDLDDTDNVASSDGVYEFVSKNRLLENPDRNSFHFAEAFGQQGKSEDGSVDLYYNIDRIWLAQNILTPSKKQAPRENNYPLFLKPDVPVEISHVMKVLRATFHGTILEHDETATRPIGVVRTLESHILTLDSEMPGQLKGVVWQAVGSPLGSVYVPFYAITDDIPATYASGNSTSFDQSSSYWAWKTLFALSGSMGRLDKLMQYRNEWETRFIAAQKGMHKMLAGFSEADYRNAEVIAKAYSTGNLTLMAESVEAECSSLLAELSAKQKDQ